MTRILLFAVILMLFTVGCKDGGADSKDSDDSIVSDMTSILEEAADVIEAVKTPKDVETAKSRIASLDKRAEDIRQLMTKRIKSRKAEEEFLQTVRLEKYRSRNKRAVERIVKALTGMDPEARKALDFESNKPLGGLVALLVRA